MTKIKESSTNFENKMRLNSECSEVYAVHIIGGQWTLAICCYLIEGKLRFSELKNLLPSITERMLSLQLKKLEENKIIKRTVFPEIPPKVEYELTEIGLKLRPILENLSLWGQEHKAFTTKD